MDDGIHLRGLAPGQLSSIETSQRWRVVGDAVSDLIGPEIEPFCADSDVFHHYTHLPIGTSMLITAMQCCY